MLRHACLISENLAIRSSGIDQSNISMFSLILASLALLGSTLCPIWIPQRRATWAGVFCNFSATENTMGLLRTLGPLTPGDPGEPKGEKACNNKSKSLPIEIWSMATETKCRIIGYAVSSLQKDERPLTGKAYGACLAAKQDGTQPGWLQEAHVQQQTNPPASYMKNYSHQ